MRFLVQSAVLATVSLSVLMVGCSTNGTDQRQSDSRYTLSQDAGPTVDIDVSELKDAVPTAEPYSRGGNRSPYTVWGKSYKVLDSSAGYQATGRASWYGRKFHGHKTSNGETYDMYAMSAAHKNLPLPSFVQVTNLANNRKVIVRVNDRGPFHSERIIDLSYAAAKKLGFADKGTARVHVAAISVSQDGTWTVAGDEGGKADSSDIRSAANSASEKDSYARDRGAQQTFVQVGAFRDPDSAADYRRRIEQVTEAPVRVVSSQVAGDGWHRVHVGPFPTRSRAEAERQKIESRRLGDPIVVMGGGS